MFKAELLRTSQQDKIEDGRSRDKLSKETKMEAEEEEEDGKMNALRMEINRFKTKRSDTNQNERRQMIPASKSNTGKCNLRKSSTLLQQALVHQIIVILLLLLTTCIATIPIVRSLQFQQFNNKELDALLALETQESSQATQTRSLAASQTDFRRDQSQSQIIQSSISVGNADSNQLYILGLFDLHRRSGPIGCGALELDSGEQHSRRPMQNLEAFLWAIEQVNANSTLLPGVQLGSIALDTCSSLGRTYIELGSLLSNDNDNQNFRVNPRNVLGVIADQADWQAVEATVKISSSHNLTTFVTQSRSTKLNEDARHLSTTSGGATRRLGAKQDDKAFLSEMLGIGHPSSQRDRSVLLDYEYDEQQGSNNNPNKQDSSANDNPSPASPMFMIRMGVPNEVIADAIGTFLERMNWTLISVVYSEDEPDMLDLRNELLVQLLSRGVSVALDERIKGTRLGVTEEETLNGNKKLIEKLIKKSKDMGSRVVLTLANIGGARNLFQALDVENTDYENNLLFLSVIDREPYYLWAKKMLGAINLSSSSSLSKDFQNYFRSNRNQQHFARNRWWPEYMGSIAQQYLASPTKSPATAANAQQQDPKLTALNNGYNSDSNNVSLPKLCDFKSLSRQPIISTRNFKSSEAPCGLLDIGDLIQEELKLTSSSTSSININKQQSRLGLLRTRNFGFGPAANNNKLQYLPSGWEHNGWEVINSVFAMAHGLELVRQTLCPTFNSGLCPEMVQLIAGTIQTSVDNRDMIDAHSPSKQDDFIDGLGAGAGEMPPISQLVYSELTRSAFQLPDGKTFSLSDLNQLGSSQLEIKVKFYNLRQLDKNAIGFVKFGHYDQASDELQLNLSKAQYYFSSSRNESKLMSNGDIGTAVARDGQPIDRLKSACLPEQQAACQIDLFQSILLAHPNIQTNLPSSVAAINGINKTGHNHKQDQPDNNNGNSNDHPSMPSLLKLDHPLIWASSNEPNHNVESMINDGLRDSMNGKGVYVMRAKNDKMTMQTTKHRKIFNILMVTQLHNNNDHTRPKTNSHSSSSLRSQKTLGSSNDLSSCNHSSLHFDNARDLETAYEQIAGISMVQDKLEADPRKPFELRVVLIDQCALIANNLTERLKLIDGIGLSKFDNGISSSPENLLVWNNFNNFNAGVRVVRNPFEVDENLVYISDQLIKAPSSVEIYPKYIPTSLQSKNENLNIKLEDPWLQSESLEFNAIIDLLKSMPNWKLVHLIYTDNHSLREKYVTELNMAGICLSKMIWVPSPAQDSGRTDDELYELDVESLRNLFAAQLHDYHDRSMTSSLTHADEGLNATRVLIVLASKNAKTNRMILDAASESMLEDYVWLTTDKWLTSVELEDELSRLRQNHGLHDPGPKPQLVLPTNLISTRRQMDHRTLLLRHFMAKLTPALTSTIPSILYDQFYQLMNKCRFPFSTDSKPLTMDGDDDMSSWPICNLGTTHHHAIQDYLLNAKAENHKVTQTMLIMETIYETINELLIINHSNSTLNRSFDPEIFANKFKATYEYVKGHTNLNAGFDVVIRLSEPSGRRANSRNLALASEESQLEKVGLWRRATGYINWADQGAPTTTTPSINNSFVEQSDQQEISQLARDSYGRLADIKSLCSDTKVCELCSAQLERSKEFTLFERTQVSFLSSVTNPILVSSMIPQYFSPSHIKKQERETSSGINPTSNDLSQVAINKDQRQGSPIEPAPNSSNNKDNDSLKHDLQASASSLFDSLTVKEIETNRDAIMRKVSDIRGEYLGSNFFSSGWLLAVLSLSGILSIVIIMMQVYPTYIIASTGSPTSPTTGNSNGFRQLDQINDHFLMVGLLMLYSINVAFMMPATISICAFRRFGLASSYTLIFGAMLVKLLDSRKQMARHTKSKPNKTINQQANNQSSSTVDRQSRQSSQETDPEVELSFESLPPDSNITSSNVNSDPLEDQSTGNHNAQSQTFSQRLDQQNQIVDRNCDYQDRGRDRHAKQEQEGASLLIMIPCGLLLIELMITFIWFIQQSPEPTLYHGCWRCASPMRSPVTFLYESLISLLYPALILLTAWICAILNYKAAKRNENIFRVERISLLRGQPVNWANRLRESILASQSRDSRAFLMCTTLLVVAWCLLTLTTISYNSTRHSHIHSTIPNRLLSGGRFGRSNSVQIDPLDPSGFLSSSSAVDFAPGHNLPKPSTLQQDDINLVYTNIISGAIIFVSLFLYRLRLLDYLSLGKLKTQFGTYTHYSSKSANVNITSSTNSTYLPSNQSQPLRFNVDNEHQTNRSVSWLDSWSGRNSNASGYQVNESFLDSQQTERLRMQQFACGSYGSATTSSRSNTNERHGKHSTTKWTANRSRQAASDISFGEALAARFSSRGAISKEAKKHPKRNKQKSLFASSTSLLFGSNSSLGVGADSMPAAMGGNGVHSSQFYGQNGQATARLHRRQSANSTSSSTAALIRGGSLSQHDVDDIFDGGDTISVASSSASQLQGNELYPIDCSIQISDNNQTAMLAGAGSLPPSTTDGDNDYGAGGMVDVETNFLRKDSFRGSSRRNGQAYKAAKLSAVIEENQANNKT